jgi:6-phosphogluconolactonase (cycloisomerase 2 family)
MWTRFTWIVAVLALIVIGVLMACSTKYNSSYNGLLVVPSQGSAVMQSFTLNLSNGQTSQINNVNGPPTPGLPTAVILDPPGAFAYVVVQQNAALNPSTTGIATFQIASDGKLSYLATTPMTNPVALTMDSAGKFLFVANGSEGTVSVFSIGSKASLTEVTGSPFALPLPPGGQNPSASAFAVTPTVLPPLYAPCSGFAAPKTENLYVADSVNYLVLNYSVSSSGSLILVPTSTTTGFPTGPVPDGVAVDPCNRFVYVANAGPNNTGNSVSAYKICTTVSQPNCPVADYRLLPVAGSPFPAGDSPGPMSADAYGNFLYVVNTGSNNLSAYRISPTTGALAPLSPATVATGLGPNSIAVRSDDTWMFVANIGTQGTGSQTVSEYGIVPSTGGLLPQTPITSFDYPSGVAVTQTGNP